MAMTITPDRDSDFDTEFAPSGRRRKITKFALAGVAVLGVGAALTSAAWTDNVFFGGATTAGDADLQGSSDNGTTWAQGSTNGTRIIIDDFEDVGPGISVSKQVLVENIGSTDLALTLDAAGSGPMFATSINANGDSGAATVSATLVDPVADAVLESGETAAITVTVTGWEYWPDNFQGRNGSVVVNVQGTVGLD